MSPRYIEPICEGCPIRQSGSSDEDLQTAGKRLADFQIGLISEREVTLDISSELAVGIRACQAVRLDRECDFQKED